MEAQDLGPAADKVGDELALLGIGALAQQGGDGLLGHVDAAPEDECGHRQTHEAVHLPAGQALHHGGQQNGGGGDDVIAAVGGGGHEGGRIDHDAQLGVETAEPELDDDGTQQNTHGDPLQVHRAGVQDLADGGLGQLIADDQDQSGNGQAGQVFEPGVAEGMMLVGRLLRQVEAHQGDDGGAGVGEVVHGVGGDGNGAGQGTHCQLGGEEQQVADDADDAGKTARSSTGVLGICVSALQNEASGEKFSHWMPPEYGMF